jgi:NADPH-dependent 2,4-dienoyl-CoA reductase/sulfur reductase-like enzyme
MNGPADTPRGHRDTVTLVVDGVPVAAVRGQSVAAALLSRGGATAWHVRTSVTGAPRGPLCGMGVCFECRATVDGRELVRTCQKTVRNGMRVDTSAPAAATPRACPAIPAVPRHGSCDVLVVGAGPAGIAAASAAATAGADVIVIDDNPAPGGQIWRGGAARPEGGARFFPGTAVVTVTPSGAIRLQDAVGIRQVVARRIVLATGARERFVPFPGWTLPGVVGAGGLQALVKQGLDVARRRVVVAGSGPLLLAGADVAARSGARLVAIAEQADRLRLAGFAARLVAEPAKRVQAIWLARTTAAVYRPATFPVAVRAAVDGLVVTLRSGRPGRERDRDVACDILACGFGLVPNTDVARAFGCAIGADGVLVDERQRTTRPDVFAAGECTGIGGVDKSLVEGRVAGLMAVGAGVAAAPLLAEVRRARQFAARLLDTFALDPRLCALASADTVVCRCEDVVAERLRGFTGWREAKLLSRVGMGPCQGRVCGTATAVTCGFAPDDVRPPLVPVPTGALADVVSP